MRLTRRDFFSSVSTALVGGFVATNVPIGWLPKPIRAAGVSGYLTRLWNDFVRANGRMPVAINISLAMFEQFKSELTTIARIAPGTDPYEHRGVLFKSTTVGVSPSGMTILT